MPRQHHKRIIPLSSRRRKPRVSHEQKLAYLSQYKRIADPTNERSIAKQYALYKKFPIYLQRPATKEQRVELKKRGFFTTDKGVIIDGPRTSRREPIKGAKMTILADATIKWEYKDRRDYIVGMTAKDKKEFALHPQAFIDKKEAELRKRIPSLRHKRKIQARLQWGAYQATKDFAQSAFTMRYKHIPERDKKRVKDRLTGIHFVVHQRRGKSTGDMPHLTGVHFTVRTRRKKK